MAITFYPYETKVALNSLGERLDLLRDGAEQYKAAVLDTTTKTLLNPLEKKRITPRDLAYAFNWEEIASVLREVRDLPEATPNNKTAKAESFNKLAEIYEVLRAAKMPKLEAVRLALINEAKQLTGGSQVA